MTIPSTIPGYLIEQLNNALMAAFPSVSALRIMVLYELTLNLDEMTPAQGALEDIVFELVKRAIAYNWVDRLVIGACRRRPQNEQLRAVAEALGISAERPAAPTARVTPPDLLSPHRFDLNAQVQLIADKMQPGQLVGFITYDNDPTFLRNLRQRLHDDLGRDLVYCYPTTLQVSEVKQPASVVLTTILANAYGRLPHQDVIFIVGGLRTEAQLASFWAKLQTALVTVAMRGTLVVIFACEPEVPPPPALHRLDAVHFTKADLQLWIRAIAKEQSWDANAINVWFQTVLQCASHDNNLVTLLIYDHLHFASEKLPGIKMFAVWEVKLQEWSQYYV